MPISIEGTHKNKFKLKQDSIGDVVTPFFTKKSLTKTDRCAGALSYRRNQLLFLHFSGLSLLTTSLKWLKMLMYISLSTVANSVNYTSEFRETLKLLTK
jgi:hypothetical protein